MSKDSDHHSGSFLSSYSSPNHTSDHCISSDNCISTSTLESNANTSSELISSTSMSEGAKNENKNVNFSKSKIRNNSKIHKSDSQSPSSYLCSNECVNSHQFNNNNKKFFLHKTSKKVIGNLANYCLERTAEMKKHSILLVPVSNMSSNLEQFLDNDQQPSTILNANLFNESRNETNLQEDSDNFFKTSSSSSSPNLNKSIDEKISNNLHVSSNNGSPFSIHSDDLDIDRLDISEETSENNNCFEPSNIELQSSVVSTLSDLPMNYANLGSSNSQENCNKPSSSVTRYKANHNYPSNWAQLCTKSKSEFSFNNETNNTTNALYSMINSLASNSFSRKSCPNHQGKKSIPFQHAQLNSERTLGSDIIDLRMSSIQATTIISNYCNTENFSNPSSSAAVTTLTSSCNGLPVTALTVMEYPKISANRSYNWQAYMPSLKDRMATIFNRDILSDVYFIVGKNSSKTKFFAHKFILSIGSAVFNAMFNGPLARASNSEKCTDSDVNDRMKIELPDIEPEAFQALLRFLYFDQVQIDPETVMTTLYAAKKYEILALEIACVNFLKANLNPENCFMLLTQALLFDETNLADMCLDMIDKYTIDALYSDAFFEIDLNTLKFVLGRDTLRVREVSLFIAVMKWAEFECQRKNLEVNSENKRLVLGDALFLLRFPLMSIDEFALYAAQTGVLTDKEVVNLFLYYTVNSKLTVSFPIEPRCCFLGEEYSVNRFQRTENRWGYSGTSDRIRFITDRPICVTGFGLYGSIQGPSEYEVIIEIIHTGSRKVIASNESTFTSDGTDSTFKVMFDYPVEIAQNTNYTACSTLKGVDTYYGTNGCRTITVDLPKDEKNSVTFQFSYAAGCNNGTSVEDGQIPEIYFYVD